MLGERHAPLTDLLGKTSSRDMDKCAELKRRGFNVLKRFGVDTIEDCLGVVELHISSLQDAGDHDLALCDVTAHLTLDEEGRPLYTGYLRENDFI